MILALAFALFLIYFSVYIFKSFLEDEPTFEYMTNIAPPKLHKPTKLLNIKKRKDENLINIINRSSKISFSPYLKIKKGRMSIRV